MAGDFDPDAFLAKTDAPAAPPPPAPDQKAFDPDAFLAGKPQAPAEADLPMPGYGETLGLGLKRAVSDVGETLDTSKPVTPPTEKEKTLQQPYEWRDLYEPSRGLHKVLYQLSQSSPSLAGGIVGGAVGAATPVPGATLAGGALGAAAGSVAQTLGPMFHVELQKTPNDPDGAYSRAIEHAAVSGAFSGAGWAAFPMKIPGVQGAVKNLLFQAFGVQPGIGVAEQATQNVVSGKPATDNLGQAYVQGAVGTAAPMIGHALVTGSARAKTPVDPDPRTPQQEQLLQQAPLHEDTAAYLKWQADQPGVMSDDAMHLKQQATDLEQQAQQARFEGNRPNIPVQEVGRVKRWLIDNIMPEMQSDKALQADPLFARFRSAAAQGKDAIVTQAMRMYYGWQKVPVPDRVSFMQAYEHAGDFDPAKMQAAQADLAKAHTDLQNAEAKAQDPALTPQDRQSWADQAQTLRDKTIPDLDGQVRASDLASRYPWMRERAQTFQKWLSQAFEDESKYGSRADYLTNYFPHLFKNPLKAQQVVQRVFANELNPQTMGQGYQKGRYYDDINKALAAGLELKYDNPEDMIAARLMAGRDMMEKMKLLGNLYDEGVAVPADKAPPDVARPNRNDPNPWKEVAAPNGEKWLIAPDVQPLWRNAVEAKGLWADQGQIGNAFRGWMALKNAWVPIKLGLSMFHPIHVWHINMAHNLGRAMRETLGPGQQGMFNRAAAIPRAIGYSAHDTAMAVDALLGQPIRWITGKENLGLPHIGREAREAWLTTPREQTARQRALNSVMHDAGITTQMPEQMRLAGSRNFYDAINKGQYFKSIPYAFNNAIKSIAKPLFEEWIPGLKTAAIIRDYQALTRQHPELLNDPKAMNIAMRTLGKQVDNRFGEMFYGSLFWNRTLKDAAIGSFLSLGWNLGFTREFVGGLLEPSARRLMQSSPSPTRALIRQTQSKALNVFLYAASAMIFNAAIQKAMTGQNPSEYLDYIFPKSGGVNPDGSPRRMSNPFFTREVPMLQKHIEEQQSALGGIASMVENKLLFAPFTQLWNNRDYYGGNIWDENAPAYKQAQQAVAYLFGEQMNPITITGAQRSLSLSGKPHTPGDVFKQIGDKDVWPSFLGFGPAPSYASRDAVQNRISFLYNRYVAPQEKPYREAQQVKERADLYQNYRRALATKDSQQIHDSAVALAKAGVSTRTIKSIASKNMSQYQFQMIGQKAPSEQVSLLKEMSPDQFKEYFRFASKKAKLDPQVVSLFKHYYSDHLGGQ